MPSSSISPLFPDKTLPDPQDLARDINAAIEQLSDLIRAQRPRINEIKVVVAEHYGFATIDIDGPLKNMNLVFARHVTWYLSRKFNGMSLPEIGRRCGGYDHTSVRHGIQRIERIVLHTPLIAEELEVLRQKIAERVLQRGRTSDDSHQKSN